MEHDKNPDVFFNQIFWLKTEGYKFKFAVLGVCYQEKPGLKHQI